MDEKVLEEIRFHQDAVTRDANSPLYQIREKEMEISGRVFAARNQADKMISDARQRALEIVRNAQHGCGTARQGARRPGSRRRWKVRSSKSRAKGVVEVGGAGEGTGEATERCGGLRVKLVTTV